MAETKTCADCKQEFQVNERGLLVVPFIPPTTCEKCGKPVHIEYHDDWVSYDCGGHFGAASLPFGMVPLPITALLAMKHVVMSDPSCSCCVCQQKKGFVLNTYQGYHLWGGGTAIRLHCNDAGCRAGIPGAAYFTTSILHSVSLQSYFPAGAGNL